MINAALVVIAGKQNQLMSKLIYGVGINDATYVVQPTVGGKQVMCPYYQAWKSMLCRGYSKKYKGRKKTYQDVTVCFEWLTFSNFKAWMETQDWEGKQLDKDLLVPGNKVYSPETCVFVSRQVNQFINTGGSGRNGYPTGVSWDRFQGKYKASIGILGLGSGSGSYNLGRYDSIEEAHEAWLSKKLEMVLDLAAEQDNPKVAEALLRFNFK